MSNKHPPYVDKELLSDYQTRENLYKTAINTNTIENWRNYRNFRNSLNIKVNNKKKLYYTNKFKCFEKK